MKKIAIIKLGAKGDVIRTLPVIKAIKVKNENSIVHLYTKNNIIDLILKANLVDGIFSYQSDLLEEYDVLYNFDIEDEATSLSKKTSAKEKFGFTNEADFVSTHNLGAEYYLNTLFDDETKISNKKTYQEMMFMAAEIPFVNIHVPIDLSSEDLKYSHDFLSKNQINNSRLIGIHMGASPRWPSKVWNKECIIKFIKLAKENNYEILLFGGPDEVETHSSLINELKESNIKVFQNNPNNTNLQFTSLVNSCKAMICSDSFSLHVSIALKIPTIGLFFCTTPHEVETYNILEKVTSPMLYDFFPAKMDQYSDELTKSISPEEVLSIMQSFQF
jgi:ADP-heptose:LPS heptosyltransferase